MNARFAAAVERLAPAGGRLGLAVSGGPDSMAMLLVACENLPDFEVATVDHGLRPEASEECALVERVCAERNVAWTMLAISVPSGNTQAQARLARYAALGEWASERGLSAILTAHHADDQAETLMMRLNRGSGLGGLAGIRASAMIAPCPVPVLRPLLGVRRYELANLVAESGIAPAHDPSNADASYERVRIRRKLNDADWVDVPALARSAELLAEAEATLSDIADHHWKQADASAEQVRFATTPWRHIDLRLLQRGVRHFGGEASLADMSALLEKLTTPGARANVAGVLVERSDAGYSIRREPPRRN